MPLVNTNTIKAYIVFEDIAREILYNTDAVTLKGWEIDAKADTFGSFSIDWRTFNSIQSIPPLTKWLRFRNTTLIVPTDTFTSLFRQLCEGDEINPTLKKKRNNR